MPYVIDRPTKRRRALAVASVAMLTWLGAAGLAAAPALADTDTSSCSDPVLTQPFTAFNDQNYYTLVPGETAGNFDGSGWTLTGGASVTTTTLADGSTGSVLDLPSGATAVSPDLCVNSTYPTARTMVNDVAGDGTVRFSASYQVPGAGRAKGPGRGAPWLTSKGLGDGWALSRPVQLHPPKGEDWTIARFRFSSSGSDDSDFQLYDFYVDPYSRG
jgi:hypothetical protein